MFQSELIQILTERDYFVKSCSENYPIDGTQQSALRQSEDNPFSFTPQRIVLHKDHQLFENVSMHSIAQCIAEILGGLHGSMFLTTMLCRSVKMFTCTFAEDGDIHRHMYLRDLSTSDAEDKSKLSVSEFTCHISGCSHLFSTVEDYEHHYNSLHRHVCCSCRCSLPSSHLLDIHIQEWHDSLFTVLAQRQDMYQCLVEGCGQTFRTSKQRRDHVITLHKYPPDFRFDKTKKDKRMQEMKSRQKKDADMDVMDDVCKSEGVCDGTCHLLLDYPEERDTVEPHVSKKETAHAAKFSFTGTHSDPNIGSHGTTNTSTESSKPQYSYRVPATVCFGQGSSHGFRGWRGRRK